MSGLELSQVPVQILLVAGEVDDRIAHQLPGSVERDVAAALDLEAVDAAGGEQLGCGHEVRRLRRPAERDDRVVFDEQQHIVLDVARDPGARDCALQLQDFAVRAKPEMDDVESRHFGAA